MSVVIVLAALAFLTVVAYRGHSVVLFAPVAALGAVLLTDPRLVPPAFTGVYMERLAGFLQLYLPVFVLGAVFGKVVELAGFSEAIVAAVLALVGPRRATLAVVLVCAVLTYGGVSLFVVVFAVYPFAAELYRRADIPKRQLPAAVALGAFSFTMDALPGTPQIQNLIPTAFFGTTAYAAPWLGVVGAAFILVAGLGYLDWRRRRARAAGEGYGAAPLNEPAPFDRGPLPHPMLAVLPLVLVGVLNRVLTAAIPAGYGPAAAFGPATQDVSKLAAIWAVEGALLVGIGSVFVLAWRPVTGRIAEGSRAAVGGALLAALNTASEYGFGAVVAALPGFRVIAGALASVPGPLVNEAVTVTTLAGITGSASGGLSIALAALSDTFVANAHAAGIPLEVCHRVAAMASGGMDTLPHNGAVITLLTVTGLTHRQAYADIFAITLIKTAAVGVVIAVFHLTGVV
ncbi:GntP family permease [Urbifossiella limnaea]|uniref:Citrate transporter n=1 Tax=Urbifossiella limnaea TaxID=2528023 RepID=A0A517XNJ4_9BACT|nr:GntP family permease [Urbifossiella limnaea]QDU19085.1 Citrate transporter [Urbifossiella limnaea]